MMIFQKIRISVFNRFSLCKKMCWIRISRLGAHISKNIDFYIFLYMMMMMMIHLFYPPQYFELNFYWRLERTRPDRTRRGFLEAYRGPWGPLVSLRPPWNAWGDPPGNPRDPPWGPIGRRPPKKIKKIINVCWSNIYLYIYISTYIYIYKYISIYIYIYIISICLSLSLSIYIYIYIHMSTIYLSIYLSIYLYIYLSNMYLSLSLYIYIYIKSRYTYLSLYIYMYIYIYIYIYYNTYIDI